MYLNTVRINFRAVITHEPITVIVKQSLETFFTGIDLEYLFADPHGQMYRKLVHSPGVARAVSAVI